MKKYALLTGMALLYALSSILPAFAAASPEHKETFSGLPVTHIEVETPPNAWGTAILLPQYHRSPAAPLEDSKNDKAEKSQKELYQVLKRLITTSKVTLVMVEGEPEGTLPLALQHQLTLHKTHTANLKNALTTLQNTLKAHPVDPLLEQKLIHSLHSEIKKRERQSLLAGAPQNLLAEGVPFTLQGAESAHTLSESRKIVREYIYLHDRLTQIQPKAPQESDMLQKSFNGLKETVSKMKEKKTAHKALTQLEQKAQKTNNTIAQKELKKLKTLLTAENTPLPGHGIYETASRNKNPFSRIKNTAELYPLIKKNKEKISQIIIEKRNKESAAHFAKALKHHTDTTAILQFGAGHTKGIVQELKKQGLKVIIITTESLTL